MSIRNQILSYLTAMGHGSLRDISRSTGVKWNSVKVTAYRMVDSGDIVRVRHGVYRGKVA